MNNVIKHQIIFILFCEFTLLAIFFLNESNYNIFRNNPILFFSFLMIGSIGISHGAMDGKIIWEFSKSNIERLKIFSIYLMLVLFGLLIWYYKPIIGLCLLLIMSIFHFAKSDLFYADKLNDITKYSWGTSMTLMPIIFYPIEVMNIFNSLTKNNFSEDIFGFFSLLALLACFFYICSSLYLCRNNSRVLLSILELFSLIILAKFVHPLIWFAIYFCGLHGIRALIGMNFKKSDSFWLASFTIPIILFLIYLTKNNTYNFSNNLYVIFPLLASLTIAHMSLGKILKVFKGYGV